MNTMDFKGEFTRKEADALIRRAPAGTEFCVYVAMPAPVENSDSCFPIGICGHIDISRKTARRPRRVFR